MTSESKVKLPMGIKACPWHACLIKMGDDALEHKAVCTFYLKMTCNYFPKRAATEVKMRDHLERHHGDQAAYRRPDHAGFKVDERSAAEMLQAAIATGFVTPAPSKVVDVEMSLPAPKARIPRVAEQIPPVTVDIDKGKAAGFEIDFGTELDDFINLDEPDANLQNEESDFEEGEMREDGDDHSVAKGADGVEDTQLPLPLPRP